MVRAEAGFSSPHSTEEPLYLKERSLDLLLQGTSKPAPRIDKVSANERYLNDMEIRPAKTSGLENAALRVSRRLGEVYRTFVHATERLQVFQVDLLEQLSPS
jgi:hypothetical protein